MTSLTTTLARGVADALGLPGVVRLGAHRHRGRPARGVDLPDRSVAGRPAGPDGDRRRGGHRGGPRPRRRSAGVRVQDHLRRVRRPGVGRAGVVGDAPRQRQSGQHHLRHLGTPPWDPRPPRPAPGAVDRSGGGGHRRRAEAVPDPHRGPAGPQGHAGEPCPARSPRGRLRPRRDRSLPFRRGQARHRAPTALRRGSDALRRAGGRHAPDAPAGRGPDPDRRGARADRAPVPRRGRHRGRTGGVSRDDHLGVGSRGSLQEADGWPRPVRGRHAPGRAARAGRGLRVRRSDRRGRHPDASTSRRSRRGCAN